MATNELTDLINAIVEKKTFSLEAVQAIEEIRKKAAKLEGELVTANDNLKAARAEVTVAKAKNDEWQQRETSLIARETAVAEREKKITELEKTTAVASARADVYGSVVDRIFANRMMRESIITDQPVSHLAPGSSYPTTNYQQKRDNIAREEG